MPVFLKAFRFKLSGRPSRITDVCAQPSRAFIQRFADLIRIGTEIAMNAVPPGFPKEQDQHELIRLNGSAKKQGQRFEELGQPGFVHNVAQRFAQRTVEDEPQCSFIAHFMEKHQTSGEVGVEQQGAGYEDIAGGGHGKRFDFFHDSVLGYQKRVRVQLPCA